MTNTERQIVAVIDGPGLVGGVPRRLVEFAEGSGQVQSWRQPTWVGARWLHPQRTLNGHALR